MKRSERPGRSGWTAWVAVLAFILIFGLRAAPSFTQGPQDAAPDLSVPFRYIGVGWLDWAAVQLKELAETPAPGEELLFILGLAHESLGEYEAALEVYERIIRSFPDRPQIAARAAALAGNVSLRLGRIGAAKRLFAESHAAVPGQALVLSGLGVVAEAEGDLAGALDWFGRAMEASPKWAEPAIRAAGVHIRLEEPEAAVALLGPYEAFATRDPEYFAQLAAAYAMLAEFAASGRLEPRHLAALPAGAASGGDLRATFADLARHAVDRIRQLDPAHPDLDGLFRLLSEISPP